MYAHEITIRIAYADTDVMGFVYYGNYPRFYEIGRTEMIRSLGMTYREMEEKGVLMPVVNLSCEYIKPAHYDDLIRMTTMLRELPKSRIKFYYELFNPSDELIHKAETELIFLDSVRRKPVRAPQYLIDKLLPYFGN